MPKAVRVLLLALVVSAPLTVTLVVSSTHDPSWDSVLRLGSRAAPVAAPSLTVRSGRLVLSPPRGAGAASVDVAVADPVESPSAVAAGKKFEAVPKPTTAATAKPVPKPKAKPKAKAKPKSHAKPKPHAKPKAKARVKAKAKAAPKAKPKAKASATKRYPQHGAITTGHYIRSLHDNVDSSARMWALGAADAARNVSHAQYLVLLDIGGQVPGGVMLSTTHRVVTYPALRRDIGAYLRGYHARQHSDAPVIVAIGTNNDLHVSTRVGQIWAHDLVNPLVAYVQRNHMGGMTIAGANDIEPGFAAGPKVSEQWVHGFLMSTHAQLIFNGSADGCPTDGSLYCVNGWTTVDLAFLAGAMSPGRILALPQIYNYTMAAQWARIAQTAVRHSHVKLAIVGPLTENAACGGDPYCPTMPTWPAWTHLQTGLMRVGLPARTPPIAVDLDVR